MTGIWVKAYPDMNLSAIRTWATVTGGTVSTVTKANGAVMEVHTFLADSSLVCVTAGFAEVLIAGGGGSGGGSTASGSYGGGGGGGGLLTGSVLLNTATHAVAVGTGGVSIAYDTLTKGNNGNPSRLGNLVAVGGGGGAAYAASVAMAGSPGGSGGGGVYGGAGGAGQPGQGYGGGAGVGLVSGGGGGAGGATASQPPGDGVVSSITGTAVTYCTGGPGWSSIAPGGDAAANTGAGGAGGYNISNYRSGTGGSGIVIVAVQISAPTTSGVIATGGTESTYVGDGVNGVLGQSYKVHQFTATGAGSFVVTQGGACDVLVVGGGGGGGFMGNNSTAGQSAGSCGGGAGGVLLTPLALVAGTLPVKVGAGGAKGTSAASDGSGDGKDGGYSQIGSVTAYGGGGGTSGRAGTPVARDGRFGGSGSGSKDGGVVGAGITEQGYAGGASSNVAGGDGGAGGGAGGLAVTNQPGPGRTLSLTGTAVEYGKGGYGYNGIPTPPATVANRGTGGSTAGSAAAWNSPGTDGSSGIVIVRYQIA